MNIYILQEFIRFFPMIQTFHFVSSFPDIILILGVLCQGLKDLFKIYNDLFISSLYLNRILDTFPIENLKHPTNTSFLSDFDRIFY